MAKAKKIGSVKIYGDVCVYGYNSAAAFIERFEEARKGADEMCVHLHTDGGNVMEGTLIYNHIKGCDIPVDVIVDGVSCSMGTVIMMAARKVYMCENSYLMVHAPRGGCFGTALEMEKTAKCLRGMEKNFKKIYATKTGRDEEGMKELLEGDNWFTAQEAMDAKLIDGIVEPIATDVTPISAEELKSQSPQALYNRFSACLDCNAAGTGEEGVFNSSNNQNKENEMDKKDLIEKFGLTGVTAQSTDAEVYAAMQAKMDADKTRADNAELALASASKKKITDAVQAALDAKKIDEKQKVTYVAIGEKSGFEALMVVLDGLKPAPSLVGFVRGRTGGVSGQATGQVASRTEWTWEQWQKEDPRGLEKMAKDEPEAFEALYKGAFK